MFAPRAYAGLHLAQRVRKYMHGTCMLHSVDDTRTPAGWMNGTRELAPPAAAGSAPPGTNHVM